MRFIFLALVIVVISLPEYEAGYMQYLKNLLSMQNQDEGKIIDSYVRQCVRESGNVVPKVQMQTEVSA